MYRALLHALALVVLAAIVRATPAQESRPAPPATVVRLALREYLQAPGKPAGEETGLNYPAFFLRKLFAETLSWEVVNVYRDRWDRPEEDDPDAGGGLFGGGEEEEETRERLAAPCDLAVAGEVRCVAKESIFYGEVQAWAFHSEGEVVVSDGAGAELARLKVGDDFTRSVRYKFKEASEFCLKRVGRKVLVAVLEHESVASRVPETHRPKVEGILRGVKAQLRKEENPTEGGE